MNNEIRSLRLAHLGEIGFRLSLCGLIVAIAILSSSIISFFIIAIVALVGFVLPFITLGMVFAVNPNYFSDLGKLLENSNSVIDFLVGAIGYVKFIAIMGIIGSILGAVFLLSNKADRHWGKFTFCLISSIVCLLLFLFIATGSFQNIVS